MKTITISSDELGLKIDTTISEKFILKTFISNGLYLYTVQLLDVENSLLHKIDTEKGERVQSEYIPTKWTVTKATGSSQSVIPLKEKNIEIIGSVKYLNFSCIEVLENQIEKKIDNTIRKSEYLSYYCDIPIIRDLLGAKEKAFFFIPIYYPEKKMEFNNFQLFNMKNTSFNMLKSVEIVRQVTRVIYSELEQKYFTSYLKVPLKKG